MSWDREWDHGSHVPLHVDKRGSENKSTVYQQWEF